MRFKGQLLIPAEGGPGLPVDLQVEGRQLSVVTEAETLGVWPLESVRVRRLAGDMFAMEVAGEDLHFVAEDTISFAYDGITAIERRNPTPRGHRAVLKGLKGLFGWEDGLWLGQAPTSDTATDSNPPDSSIVESEQGTLDLTEEVQAWNVDAPDQGRNRDMDPPPDSLMLTEPDPTQPRGYQPETEWDHDSVEPPPPRGTAGQQTETCKALRNDGLPCESPIVSKSGFCYPHDPTNPVGKTFKDAQEARARLHSKRATRLGRVYSRLDKALSQVERGEMDTDQAMAMAQLARTMCAILELDEGVDPAQPRVPDL